METVEKMVDFETDDDFYVPAELSADLWNPADLNIDLSFPECGTNFERAVAFLRFKLC